MKKELKNFKNQLSREEMQKVSGGTVMFSGACEQGGSTCDCTMYTNGNIFVCCCSEGLYA